jgi:hypothetical protein
VPIASCLLSSILKRPLYYHLDINNNGNRLRRPYAEAEPRIVENSLLLIVSIRVSVGLGHCTLVIITSGSGIQSPNTERLLHILLFVPVIDSSFDCLQDQQTVTVQQTDLTDLSNPGIFLFCSNLPRNLTWHNSV